MRRRFIIKFLKINCLILGILVYIVQNVALASVNVTYKTIGNITTFYSGGKVVGTYKTKNMPNGFVETEACYGGYCYYDIMTPMRAKNYIYSLKEKIQGSCNMRQWLEEIKTQAQKEKQIKQANKSIIVKEVTVSTPNGEKISLQEDKNGDDYLVINGKKVETIGRGIATNKDVVYDPFPEKFQLENVIKIAQREDYYKTEKRSYDEIIYSSRDLCDLFKLVYKLRVEHGVSYEDAQKLMTFGIDNRHYKPSDLLFPSEKQAIKFKKNRENASEKLKNVTFPKFRG